VSNQNEKGAVLWSSERGQSLALSGPFAFLQMDTNTYPPRGMNLTALEASALAHALLEGAAELEKRLPSRCACGEPIESDEHECVTCYAHGVRARRGLLHILD